MNAADPNQALREARANAVLNILWVAGFTHNDIDGVHAEGIEVDDSNEPTSENAMSDPAAVGQVGTLKILDTQELLVISPATLESGINFLEM